MKCLLDREYTGTLGGRKPGGWGEGLKKIRFKNILNSLNFSSTVLIMFRET